MLNIVTNPVIIGLFFGVVTYLYLLWSTSKKKSKRHSKHGKKNKDKNIEKPGFLIPGIVAICTWAAAYFYKEYYSKKTNSLSVDEKYSIKKDATSDSEAQRSFRMIRTGVPIPKNLGGSMSNLPDVFINTI